MVAAPVEVDQVLAPDESDGTNNTMENVALCNVCRSISLTTLPIVVSPSPGCAFCSLVQDSLAQSRRVQLEADEYDAAARLSLHLHNHSLVVSDGVLTGRIRLSAHPDSPAFLSGQIVCTPPLPSPDSPEAYSLVQHWLQSCILNHPRCRETLSNARIGKLPPLLPLRVIDVSSPRIVELQKRARYVSLSHCWGHPEKHPLTTTKASLPQHRRQIPWDALPRTFQNAITVVRQLGLRYLWIDSLCIVQDDARDWEQESAKMGDIYEKATLTIGASHAADSTEGFFWERGPASSVTLPYRDAAGVQHGHMYASLLPDDYRHMSPEFGPLSERAWATQEWLLSRRMLFYTRGCIVWSCRTTTLRETRDAFYSTARNTRWKVVVEKYSARSLTHRTDRLVALQGLTNALSRRNRSCVLGVWDDALADQLLWFSVRPAQRALCPLALPSWTWASSLHGVRFQKTAGARAMFRSAHVVGAHIEITGLLKPLPPLRAWDHCDEDDQAADDDVDIDEDVRRDAQHNLASNDARHAGAWKLVRLVYDGVTHQTIGWASLDEGAAPDQPIYCLALLGLKTQNQDCGKPEFYRHWALLVAPRDGVGRGNGGDGVNQEKEKEENDAFIRVGVAKILARSWFGDVRMREVRIF
ncbi:heterokaryon incompatibility protein-domain-containing protein [Phyllosticta capitalensis]|uniref:Heterokaryon incompatibility protein-domain-containing protein n=1 Tax=Phyllosticta capitalensis TaxID=121624 RepID=A0ABR1YFF2_9PEZI